MHTQKKGDADGTTDKIKAQINGQRNISVRKTKHMHILTYSHLSACSYIIPVLKVSNLSSLGEQLKKHTHLLLL